MNPNADTLENHLRELEECLLQPDVRKSARVSELLADNFVEFGSSGCTFTKSEIIATLSEETPTQVTMSEFRMQLLADNLALVTYRMHRHTEPPVYALRSSIWKLIDGQWRMVFHQGTLTSTPRKKEMPAREVVELLTLFEQNNIMVWVDGGWGVDALLGRQTRPHDDLDIALYHKDVPKLRQLLEARNYKEIQRDDTKEYAFVMGDAQDQRVDVHSFIVDEQGKNIFGVAYPIESLTGTGIIEGHPVKCIPAEWMVKFHTGYKLDENDYRDVLALCQRFDIPLPEEYAQFTTKAQRHEELGAE